MALRATLMVAIDVTVQKAYGNRLGALIPQFGSDRPHARLIEIFYHFPVVNRHFGSSFDSSGEKPG